MGTQPSIVERQEQPYVAVKAMITMTTFGVVGDRLQEIFGWLAGQGIAPVGAPFFKYNLIAMDGQLEVEAGVPIAEPVAGAGDIFAAVLPAGRYVSLTHLGHPDQLLDRTKALLEWASAQGLRWDMESTEAGERWGSRLELYKTNPMEEPDMNNWETELLFRLAD